MRNWLNNQIISLKEIFSNQGEYYDMNFIRYTPQSHTVFSYPSSIIIIDFIDSIESVQRLDNEIKVIRKKQGFNKTVCGIKNQGGKFSVEYYFFYPKEYLINSIESVVEVLKSFKGYKEFSLEILKNNNYDLVSINPVDGEIVGLNYYKKKNKVDNIGQEAIVSFYNFKTQTENIAGTQYGFNKASTNLPEVFKKINSYCKMLFPNENNELAYEFLRLPYLQINKSIVNSALYTPYCIANKQDKYIGLYFSSLDNQSFIKFLEYHEYPLTYIDKIKWRSKKIAHLNFDIALDFYLYENKFYIHKTAFYGVF